MLSFLLGISLFDFSRPKQMGFQDPATPIMEGIIDLHHHIFFFLVVILFLVVWLLVQVVDIFYYLPFLLHETPLKFLNIQYKILRSLRVSGRFTHSYMLEIIWTIIPTLVLVAIAIPSFALLYSIDEVINPSITLKAIGHQWYWSYEFTDYNKFANEIMDINFDSFMIPEDELILKELRLLEVDNLVILPIRTHIRVIVSAADVLHSWAIPSLGVKIDAVPGRLNQTTIFIKRGGLYYGQCSEICGVNHGFMPIAILGVPLNIYTGHLTD